METAVFYIFGTVALLSAVSVVAQRKVFYSAISLILCLCAVAVLYLNLEAPFIAAIQIIVYAGAIMVLFLFVIMLLDPFSAAALKDRKKWVSYAAVLLGFLTLALLLPLLKTFQNAPTPVRSGFSADETGTVEQVGRVLFNDYLLPFEITSVLILVAIIGVVVLAKQKRRT